MNDLISPEQMEIVETYIRLSDVKLTAQTLNLPMAEVLEYLEQPAIKRFIDNMYMNSGYRNRNRIGDILDEVIESKLLEAQETEHFTNYDLMDVIKLAQKIRMDEAELIKNERKTGTTSIGSQTNVQINGSGSNLDNLVSQLVKGQSE